MIRVVTHIRHSMRESTTTGDDMKKTTTGKQNKADQTGGKDPKTEQKKKAKAFNGFKTEGPKTTGTEQKKSKKKTERILLDVSGFPHDEDGRAIVPRDFMEEHYRELPDGTRSEDGALQAHKGGLLRMLGADPERDAEIHRKGAQYANATMAQRKTLAESIIIALRQKASDEEIKKYNLPENASHQDAITAAIVYQASGGNMKAFTALRDTIGEMPVARTEITADVMTAADRALVEKLSRRLDGQ